MSNASFAVDRDNLTCGIKIGFPLKNSYGPWDYTNANQQDRLPIVLNAHFNRNVATLKRGITGIQPHGDIDYTLRAIPNYHPALFAAYKLEKKDKNTLHAGEVYRPKYYSTACYFKRAIYFQPKDYTSRMLYGMYLQQNKQYSSAEKSYKEALKLDPNSVEINYNMGLLYVDMKQLEKAKKHAKIAYDAGHPLPGLKNKISRAENNN